jgi:septation ring formation regulator EzrA
MINDARIDKFEQRLDKISESVHSIDKTLAEQHISLKEHIRRTELAEKSIEAVRKEIKPLSAHVQRVDGGLRLLGLVTLILGIWAGLQKLI